MSNSDAKHLRDLIGSRGLEEPWRLIKDAHKHNDLDVSVLLCLAPSHVVDRGYYTVGTISEGKRDGELYVLHESGSDPKAHESNWYYKPFKKLPVHELDFE